MASSIDSTLDGDLTTTGQQVRKAELKEQLDAAVTDIEALQGGTGIEDDAVTYAKIQDVAANNVLLGNDDGAGSAIQELTKTEALAILNVEDGADVTDATNVNAAGATMNTDTDVSGNSWVLDEDTMSSDSATKVPTQQSTKAYTDAEKVPTVLFKSANYTITAADVTAPSCTVFVDASGGSVTNTQLPTVANLNGKIAKVIAETDPGTNTITVNESDGTTEIATLVEKHDFFEVTSDGTNYKVIGWKNGHYARVYVDADEAIAQGASEHITSISEDTDTGGIWNTTNDEVDIPFDCWVDLHWSVMPIGSSGFFVAEAKLDAAYIRDGAVTVNAGGNDTMTSPVLSGRFKATSGQKLELWATNIDNDSGNASIAGDAAGDESFATIKLTRIY